MNNPGSDVIERDDTDCNAFIARGEARLKILDTANAVKDFSRAIDLDPHQARPFVGRGQARSLDSNEDLALQDFDKAIEANPGHKKALRLRSQLHVERGDFQNAEADLNSLENVIANSKKEEPMAQRRTRISMLIGQHFESYPLDDLTISERQFPFRVRADLQRAVEHLFDKETRVDHLSGVKSGRSYEGVTFTDLIFPDSHSPALAVPLQYEEMDIGESEPAKCLKSGLWLLTRGELKFAIFLTATKIHGQSIGMQFQIAVPKGEPGQQIASELFEQLEKAVAESKSYRGKILSLEVGDRYSGMTSGIRVHKLRMVDRDQVILPSTTLELLDRNIVQFANQREKLASLGMSTKKGVLFYGPPGTGKTHTIHYLASAMKGHTTLLIAAEQVGVLGEYMTLARLLQPSMVVIEDADLIARERTEMESVCEEALLNKLLNEMDGLRPGTDVFFILTTNRPEALEGALASRPGRIDQAIEFPLPDDEGRTKLIKLYAMQMDVPNDVVAETVKRTDGVSASFIKELMRRAAQFHIARDGDGTLAESDVDAALQELVFTGGSLNRRLFGMQHEDAG